jgi:outer membrane protein, heavy metal efflux system
VTTSPSTRPLRLLAALLAPLAFAQAHAAATLDDVLARIDDRVGVITTRLDLEEARRASARTTADPLALRLDLTQARQAVELATAQAEAARYDAMAEFARAWASVREASLFVTLREQGFDLARRSAAIAQVRFERGGATRLDVDEAQTALRDAENNLAVARNQRDLALADLIGITGLAGPFALEAIDRERLDAPLPDEADFVAALAGLPPVMQVDHGVELSRIAVDLLDPSYASRAQIEQARTQLTQLEGRAVEARRGLTLRTQQLLSAVDGARESDRIARDALGQAREREAIEARRFDAGLIAEIALLQTRLGTSQALLRAVQAENALMRALLDLQAGTLIALEGWDGR